MITIINTITSAINTIAIITIAIITIAIITIAIITIAIITMAIITIGPGPDAHTYAPIRWVDGRWFCRNIWVGDLLSPRSNCLPILKDVRLQLTTVWPWGIVRSHHAGYAKNNIPRMISTDVIISATATYLLPPTYRGLAPATYISNNSSFHRKHPGVPNGSDGSDGTSYSLMENYTLSVARAMESVA